MNKPRAIEWLESETGQSIDYQAERTAQERHLSVRVSDELATALDEIATERGLSVSHLVRELLVDAVTTRTEVADLETRKLVNRLAADIAEVSRRLVG